MDSCTTLTWERWLRVSPDERWPGNPVVDKLLRLYRYEDRAELLDALITLGAHSLCSRPEPLPTNAAAFKQLQVTAAVDARMAQSTALEPLKHWLSVLLDDLHEASPPGQVLPACSSTR
jgi:hypothetical protein